MRELHPFLYFVEGWLTLWGQTEDQHALANARRAFGMVLGQIDPLSGEAPPIANARDAVTRTDVLAQALRAGPYSRLPGNSRTSSARCGRHGAVRSRLRSSSASRRKAGSSSIASVAIVTRGPACSLGRR